MATRRKTKTGLQRVVKAPMATKPRVSIPVAGEAQIKTLKRVLPDDLPIKFCDGLIIQHSQEMFFLSFLQTQQPLIADPSERAKLTELTQICRAQIAVSPSQMVNNIVAMNENFAGFLTTYTKTSKDVKKLIQDFNKALVAMIKDAKD